MKSFIFYSIFIFSSFSIFAQTSMFDSYMAQKNFKKAAEIANADYLKSNQSNGLYHEETSKQLNNLVTCYTLTESYSKAIDYMCSLQASNQFNYGDSVEYAAYDYQQLGILYYKNKNFYDAACCFERAFIINRKNKGENTIESVEDLHQAAISYEKVKEKERAERDYLLAINILKKIENYSPDQLRILYNELKHFYRTNKMTSEETGVQEALNTLGLEKTNDVKESEKCDCIKKLVPSEELIKLGITP